MHPTSMSLSEHFVRTYFPDATDKEILEVGSSDINGGIRHLFQNPKRYVGMDLIQRAGVDLVLEARQAYCWPLPADSFDLVISTNTLEHCTKPWLTMREMVRALRPGGLVCNVAPWRIHHHPEPLDCFRILADGMQSLMEDAGLEILECRMQDDDTIGVGRKK